MFYRISQHLLNIEFKRIYALVLIGSQNITLLNKPQMVIFYHYRIHPVKWQRINVEVKYKKLVICRNTPSLKKYQGIRETHPEEVKQYLISLRYNNLRKRKADAALGPSKTGVIRVAIAAASPARAGI